MMADVLNWEQQKILREVQSLRAEVAALDRKVEAMRGAAVEDVVDLLVEAFRQLPQRMLNRSRGFRKN
jgi:DNA-binding ferritin-like protein (Dps family)